MWFFEAVREGAGWPILVLIVWLVSFFSDSTRRSGASSGRKRVGCCGFIRGQLWFCLLIGEV